MTKKKQTPEIPLHKIGIQAFLWKMYNINSELNHIASWDERLKQAQEQSEFTPDYKDKDFREMVVKYLNEQHHDKYQLLLQKKHLLNEMMENVMTPVDMTNLDQALKTVDLKGKIDKLCDDLVAGIANLYKEIYVQEDIKETAQSIMSPEKRLKKVV